ncbi:MAG: hypothetical protein EA376_09960 [Phycisphaeraceae bacterium]|nr:MAG: hypothetical protein EA376_09960 [Phycisphaeraceae bacterium]
MLMGFVVAMSWPHIYTPEVAERWTGGVEIYNLPLGFMAGLVANVAFSLLFPGRRAVTKEA